MSFYPVEGGSVLFDARRKRLYALNVAASVTWLCVLEGRSEAQSAGVLAETFSLDAETARRWTARSFEAFGDLGLLGEAGSFEEDEDAAGREDPGLPPPRPIPAHAATYRLFDRVVALEAPSAARHLLDSLLGDLRVALPAGSSAMRLDIRPAEGDAWDVAFGSERIRDCGTTRLVPEIERLLVQAIVPATPHLLGLHTALMTRRDGQTVLLAGPSGAGKTTLSVALARAGWGLGTDELVLVGLNFGLRALPFPACIKSDSFAMIEAWFPSLAAAPTHQRYGHRIKWLRVEPQRPGPAPPYVVFLRREAGAQAQMRRLSGFVGLSRILQQCIFVSAAFRADHIEHVLEWHATLNYFELTYSDCDDAVTLLECVDASRTPHAEAAAEHTGDILAEGVAGPADDPRNILTLLQNLRPKQADRLAKTRVGRDEDGGYVMLDDFVGIIAAYSIGIGDDVSWDKDLASRGIPVFQYDPTIDAVPQCDPLFSWRKVALVAQSSGQPGEATLDEMLAGNGHAECTDLLLKIDIEGSEWDVFAAVNAGVLLQFRQIVAEFHGLHTAIRPAICQRLQKIFNNLRSTHEIIHVHGNNCGRVAFYDEYALPDVVEISFLRRDVSTFKETTEFYSARFDRPNNTTIPEIALENLYK